MMKYLRSSGLLMLALLVGTTTAFAAKEAQGVLRVEDKAKLFSAEGIKKAEDKFHDITFKATTHWTVVTLSEVPASKKADLEAVGGDKNKANRFFSELAASMFKERNEVGVITLVYANGDRLMVKTRADKGSDLHRHFSDTDCATLDDKIIDHLRAAKKKTGEEASTERDGGLLAGTSFVIDQLKDTSLPEAKKTAGSTVSKANNDVKASTGMSIWSWVCIGLVAALSIWVVIALVRALTNRGGGGGGGYGGGGGGGYGGGGGGMGFFGSFMTGMLGAAAGMWMYNSFMGGNQHGNDMSAGGTGDNNGGDNGSTDTGEGNIDGGSEGGAADWDGGDNGGGGDTGGGGDWGGGGGDTGGGGDWGGGGDTGGGGGGGDW